ncbi:MAG: TonB-dependent receptor plug domain-containing protein, partial [Bacteroidales bacterium]|nr:TonB-dependent receptor plug domain-containing protein [Bacteroidales bacterium]
SDKLIFSFVGYTNDTILISNPNENIDKLLSNTNILGEVEIVERQAGTTYSRLETLNVQNISGAELGKAACCNLSESFETNASVDASFSDAATGAKQIKLLGLSGKYVQMLTENIPNLYGLSQPYALNFIPGPWMESIQVSKGTAAVVNGYDAITGQINIEYKKPKTADIFYLNQYFNANGKAETNIDGSIIISPKWSTTVLAHVQNDFTKLNYELDMNKDNFMDQPAVTQYNFFNRWDYFGNNLTFRTGIKYIDETRKSGQLNYDFKKPSTQQDYYGVYIKTRRAEGFTKLGWVNPEKNYQSLALIANIAGHFQDSYFGRKQFDANQLSLYLNTLWQSNFNGNEHHKYNTGISLKYENLHQSLNDSLMNNKEIVPGAYFQYTGHFNKLNYIVGIRGDYHIQEKRFLITPRLNIKYNILGNLIFRVSAGKGYRKANVIAENNYFLASSRIIDIAPDLKLEDAWNFGSNITWYIPAGKREITLNIEYYRTQFVNQIIVDIENPRYVKFYNLDGKSFSNTYQIEASYQIIRGLDFTAAFRYNDVRQTIDNQLLIAPLTNKYKGIITASYKTKLEKWQFDLTAQFNGDGRIPSTMDNPTKYQREEKYPMYTIMNAQITKYFRKWEMYVGVENLLGFKQKNPIIAADNPFGEHFDSSLIYGPINGQMYYLGIRFAINKK